MDATAASASATGYDTPDIAPFRYRHESVAPAVPLLLKPTSGNAADKVGHLEPENRRPVTIIKKPPIKRASIVIEDLQMATKFAAPSRVVETVVSPNSSETISLSELHNVDSNEESGNDIVDDENEENVEMGRFAPHFGARNVLVSTANGDNRASTLPSRDLALFIEMFIYLLLLLFTTLESNKILYV